ncbi:MAG TPA: chromate resistance protein ChrB domain-containing protein [Dongiaceae bacterium]
MPAKPAYFRVKIWRRLNDLGAVLIKNAVYALPANAETQEDFEWLLREIAEGGGEAVVCEARLIDGMSDHQVRDLFNAARDADYHAIAEEARAITRELTDKIEPDKRTELKARLTRLRTRRDQTVAIDFFGANGRETADGLIGEIQETLAIEKDTQPMTEPARDTKDLKGRAWVTREGVHVDRIASAWLIKHFIDPESSFKFVPARGYAPVAGELRFDMFDAEFTHEGDRCTFEVLLAHAGLDSDRALQAISEIVHDIDLKDSKFAREEAVGIKTLIASICMATADDEERIARGKSVLDDLYRYFQKKRGSSR